MAKSQAACPEQSQRVFVALSGGVDSSVAAALLLKRGYEVAGCHIKCYNIDGCGERDAEDARRVAEQLNIPFYVFDLEEEYKKRVVNYMVDGYRRGLTPNPDVMCNKEIKFGLFLEKALALGADYIATGHYVRLMRSSEIRDPKSKKIAAVASLPRNDGDFVIASPALRGEAISLQIARDSEKDQSYFLWTLTQNQLKHCLFPIGDYTKKEVRALAKKFNLITAEKKDSQGICFLGKVALADFLKQYLPEKRGAVLSAAGQKIGEHRGAHFYTIGQRRIGIMNYESGIRGRHNATPCYVADKDIQKNTIIVAEKENPAFYKKEIKLAAVNFINAKDCFAPPQSGELAMTDGGDCPASLAITKCSSLRGRSPKQSLVIPNSKFIIPVFARLRYRQPLRKAALSVIASLSRSEGRSNHRKSQHNSYKLIFQNPQKAVAPGQSAVFYSRRGELLGGGMIV